MRKIVGLAYFNNEVNNNLIVIKGQEDDVMKIRQTTKAH